jgi:protein transport protein SEC24
MSPRTLIYYLYPRLVALHDLDTEIALPQLVETPEGTVIEKVRMPCYMRNSYHFMEANGVYLLGMLFYVFPY